MAVKRRINNMSQHQSENENISQEARDQATSIQLDDHQLDLVVGGKLHESACKGTHIPEVTIEF
jgi:Ser-tRNA(Ala) deacylase AlaX